ncbi:MAG: CmcI family methyltransferase [Microcoleaceae cyanobacterium]
MSETNLKLKTVEKGWKKLKKLSTIPIDLERVKLISNQSKDYLSDAANLESLILELGLNNEGIEEFPEKLYPSCGQGLRIWQYPIQFSKYLVGLSQLKITSYLELGIRHGGTFVATVEYLQQFNSLEYALGVDIIPCPSVVEYSEMNPKAKFVRLNTQSDEFKQVLEEYQKFDLVLIDSFHDEVQCRKEFLSIKKYADIIAFHDISNINYPGVNQVWNEVKNLGEYDCYEYTDQYEEIEHSYMGIGVAVKKDRTAQRTNKLMIEQVKTLLEEVKGVPGLAQTLQDSSNIIEDVQLDSLEMINFMLKIEQDLKIEIDFEQLDFDYFQSIAKFTEFLSRMEVSN